MKKTLVCLLLSAGAVFGSITPLLANPATTPVIPADTVALPSDTLVVESVPSATELRTDSLLLELGQRIGGVEENVSQLRHDVYNRSGFKAEQVLVVLIVALCAATAVCIVFLVLKFTYRRREKKYELERLRIERGEQLPVVEREELPVTVFIRRLLVCAIAGFVILSWVGVVSLGNLRFFEALLVWTLLAGVGYSIVHMFRLYVQRRDENR